MSWFCYGNQTKRRYRVGIWLRVRSLPKDILEKAHKKLNNKKMSIAWVVVKELQPNEHVLLEFWCCAYAPLYMGDIYTVFHLSVKEDPEWICEGDLGRGLVGQKQCKK